MRLAMVLLMLASTAFAGSVCPENTVWYGCYDNPAQITTNASLNYETSGSWTAGQPCASGCYDLVSGTLVATGSGSQYGPGCSGRVLVHDTYQLVGPAGPAVAFEAVFQVNAILNGTGGYKAGIAQSWINPGTEQCSGAANCEASIALSYAPGASFPVWAVVAATSAFPGDARATGLIRFRGLPAGYSVVSCQNYDVPTPAHSESWGGVKALYR
jgi:hypothetical protein